ncbi:hypothetical protein C2845_PM04G03580 [Panicum miliaceum]|uniref:Uncharacterized protein n=1 Tax=Panicum miliaceum TaxID=4540 RepID=A0A3L6QKZ3_PANMI|nr:hypothetical protein C2845_PM04G03580 [Panicum miliaceum]
MPAPDASSSSSPSSSSPRACSARFSPPSTSSSSSPRTRYGRAAPELLVRRRRSFRHGLALAASAVQAAAAIGLDRGRREGMASPPAAGRSSSARHRGGVAPSCGETRT